MHRTQTKPSIAFYDDYYGYLEDVQAWHVHLK